MSMQDLTADMLTRIRNAVRNHRKHVVIKNNTLNRGVAQVLRDEGYITSWEATPDTRGGTIRVVLKYGTRGENIIHHLERISRVGGRVYRGQSELPRPLQGLGVSIISTSKGVMSDRQAREAGVGGEVVAIVS